jgi:hypothetical protein
VTILEASCHGKTSCDDLKLEDASQLERRVTSLDTKPRLHRGITILQSRPLNLPARLHEFRRVQSFKQVEASRNKVEASRIFSSFLPNDVIATARPCRPSLQTVTH